MTRRWFALVVAVLAVALGVVEPAAAFGYDAAPGHRAGGGSRSDGGSLANGRLQVGSDRYELKGGVVPWP